MATSSTEDDGRDDVKTLRNHQIRAIDMLRASLASGKRRPILKAPVAFGKTLTAATIIRQALAKGKRAAFVCDAISLIDQAVKDFAAEGLHNMGVIQADHPMEDWSQPIQVASVQTLARRGMPPVDLVIVDEMHVSYQWMLDWMRDNPKIPVLGLSATPFSKGLGLHWDDLLMPATMRQLMETTNPITGRPYMSGYRPFEPHAHDTTMIKTVGDDFHQGQVHEVMSNEGLVADAVEWWKREGRNEPTLAFCVDRAHAQQVQQRFIEVGVSWGYVDKNTSRDEREAIRKKLDGKEIYGVSSVGTMIKGIDWPVGCISWLTMTKSPIKLVQGDGRGLRDNEDVGVGIGGCIFLDHAGNHSRLGYPEDIDEAFTTLCTKTKGEKADANSDEKPVPLPKKCPKCHALRPIGSAVCVNCGFEARPVSRVEEQEGELIEVKRKGKAEPTPAEKEQFYRELIHLQQQREKGPNWPDGFFKAKYGHWPAKKHGLAPLTPTLETLGFVKSRQIAFAKGRSKAA
jgi:superfamily II DNA or RNA helicase